MCTTKAPDQPPSKQMHDDKKHEPPPTPKCTGAEPSARLAEPAKTASDARSDIHTPSRSRNSSYFPALFLLEKQFRREGEVAALLGKAAEDAFEAFKIRSSAEYNKSSSTALLLLEAALKAVPAAESVLGLFKELANGAKTMALLAEMHRVAKSVERVAEGVHRAHATVERITKVTEGIEHVKDAAGATREISTHDGEATEVKERGNFEIETLHDLTDLAADSMMQRWLAEDLQEAVLSQLEFAPESVDLTALVGSFTKHRALPDGASLKVALARVSLEFELGLYESYFVDAHRVTRVTLERDGEVSQYYEGLPQAVEYRLVSIGRFDLVTSRQDLPSRHEVRNWHGNRV